VKVAIELHLTVPSGASSTVITITGTSGSITRSVNIMITVAASAYTVSTLTPSLTGVTAGYLTEDSMGSSAITVPIMVLKDQYAYLSNWSRVINSVGGDAISRSFDGLPGSYDAGVPHFFTWLNAHTFTPAQSGILTRNCPTTPAIIGPNCLRQGFGSNTISVNPYAASTYWDFSIIGNIYDSLLAVNPSNDGQLIGYMTTGFPTQLSNSQLGYTPAAGTTTSFRFTLRNDLAWQDGASLTSWDVKFSFLTLKAASSIQSLELANVVDIHALSSTTFDVNLSSFGPFTLYNIGSPTIIPGRYWSSGGTSGWDNAVHACLSSTTPDACFTTSDPSAYAVPSRFSSPTFDPLGAGAGILIGSGAFECLAVPGLPNPNSVTVGGGCTDTGRENPGSDGYYQLTRFGAGTTPGNATPGSKYFRSSGTLAVYIWSGNNGGSTHDLLNSSTVASCFGKPVGTASCTQWQKGIENPSASGAPVGFLQVSAATSFNGVHWTAPFDYLPGIPYSCCPFTNNAPTGVATFPLILYEGVSTGNTSNPFAAGTEQVLAPAATAGCTAAYPTGGYDC
jgi:hypothetical protein